MVNSQPARQQYQRFNRSQILCMDFVSSIESGSIKESLLEAKRCVDFREVPIGVIHVWDGPPEGPFTDPNVKHDGLKALNASTHFPRLRREKRINSPYKQTSGTDGGSYGGEIFDGLLADEDLQFSDFLNIIPNSIGSEVAGTAPRRLRLQLGYSVGDSSDGLCTYEDSENRDFGRDTNRLDYFSVAAFDVYGDDHLTGIGSYGGGGGTRDRDVVVDPTPVQERGISTAVAGGGIIMRRVPVGIFANNGSDGGQAVVQTLGRERGSGGGRCRIVAGTRRDQERASAIAGTGGGDISREVPVGIFSYIGSDGGGGGGGSDDDGDVDGDGGFGVSDGEHGVVRVGLRPGGRNADVTSRYLILQVLALSTYQDDERREAAIASSACLNPKFTATSDGAKPRLPKFQVTRSDFDSVIIRRFMDLISVFDFMIFDSFYGPRFIIFKFYLGVRVHGYKMRADEWDMNEWAWEGTMKVGAELMGRYGINVPKGVAVSSVEEVRKAIQTTFPNEKEELRG
ncbi:hypothetical protein L2E82_18321 [Cichorium intybus]|uniref:Uncharacterized protein n=1 Tax=Cichorium intybus TaxID=13427 RepID=A0ACB9FB68_CICIN|nr:hypothetical protein L2E82_18321 [Cichorium intybus]